MGSLLWPAGLTRIADGQAACKPWCWDLGATLVELNVAPQYIAEVAALCETTRNDVLGK